MWTFEFGNRRLLNKQIQACPEENTGLTEASMAYLYHIWNVGCRKLIIVARGLGKLFDLRDILNVYEKGRQEGMQAVDLKCEIARKRQQCRKGTFNLETDFLNLSQLTNSLLCYYHILAVRLWTIHLTFLGLSNHHKTFSCSNFVSVVSVNRYNWNNVLHKD